MSHSILIVDDEPAIRGLLKSILIEAGYSVHDVDCVAEAKKILTSHNFDLIATDLNMPGESGLDLIEHLHRQQLDIAVVMVTIMDNPIEASKILEAGIYGYIVKPFSRNLVLITIANALRRHQLEMQNKASRQNLQTKLTTITENVHVGLLLLDTELKVIEANTKVGSWFGTIPQDGFFLDNNCLHSEIDSPCSVSIHKVLTEGTPLQYKARYETANGQRDFQLSILPAIGDSLASSSAVLMLEDQTEHLTMEREFRQAQKLEAIGQLAAGIAHEINTPVQYIGDNIRFISDGLKDLEKFFEGLQNLQETCGKSAEMTECSQRMTALADEADLDYLREELPQTIAQSMEGVARITSIIKAMKEFSHPGTSEKVATDINHCLESTITVSRNEWKYVADLETELASDLPPVPCLTGELNQVFLNLIINAAHAINARVQQGHYSKGTIRVTTRPAEEGVEILIGDNGGGIPAEIQHRIFDPFFTTKGVGKGTGQGLSIARNIVIEKHGGKLSFNTSAGEGTTFAIFLPLAPV
ncbi:Histidine kinase-, DNA gyrase B-, and HSP90-like ATPase [Desulfopila aestuarii DSM 18488]|uniref:histidine kinase n=2 Tax=Desulfopila aestuarii TaxID=231440 RepID=A0A1M7YJX4_9BACT|nr:Histidine kinase-, DNA gyrase B-, and HSP90-like ATPase [Desulfopila aestuarii DSM 18488]